MALLKLLRDLLTGSANVCLCDLCLCALHFLGACLAFFVCLEVEVHISLNTIFLPVLCLRILNHREGWLLGGGIEETGVFCAYESKRFYLM